MTMSCPSSLRIQLRWGLLYTCLIVLLMSLEGKADLMPAMPVEPAEQPCKKLAVSGGRYHTEEEGLYYLRPSASCPDNIHYIWAMADIESYIFYTNTYPEGWLISASLCHDDHSYFSGLSEPTLSPLNVTSGIWTEWDHRGHWDQIDMHISCRDGKTLVDALENELVAHAAGGWSFEGVLVVLCIIVVMMVSIVYYMRVVYNQGPKPWQKRSS